MKTILFIISILIIFHATEEAQIKRNQRGAYNHFDWSSTNAPISEYLDFNLSPPPASLFLETNSIEKPVEEQQEYIPPQSFGTAILPPIPPPATPVNAAASNVRATQGAVFLGAGALGVVNLGNGAYALGSGSLGYSENRARTRPNTNVPVYPPLPATPDLIPAAVPSQQQLTPINGLNYNHPLLRSVGTAPSQYDANGYEYLQPERVAFGMPVLRIPTVRFTQQFATPTAVQQQQQQQQQQLATAPPSSYQLTIPFNGQNRHPVATIG